MGTNPSYLRVKDLVITLDKSFFEEDGKKMVRVLMKQIPCRDLEFFLKRKLAWIETPMKTQEFYQTGIDSTFLQRKNENVVRFQKTVGKLYWAIFPFIHPFRWIQQNPTLRHRRALKRGRKLQKWMHQTSTKK